VPPGETHQFDVPGNLYFKVRAEPRAMANCDNTKIGDLDITEFSLTRDIGPSETTIVGGAGKTFSLRWGK
jgi:hypothetical protein